MTVRAGLSRIPRMGPFGGNEAWLLIGPLMVSVKLHPRPAFLINVMRVGHVSTGGWCE